MYRPLLPASVVLLAVLTSLPAPARADGVEPRTASAHRSRAVGAPDFLLVRQHHVRRKSTWHTRYGASRRQSVLGAGFAPTDDFVTYGWLPRNLNLPIYNAPSEGPPPTL